MKLKLTLVSGALSEDITITADSTATVGAIAERLRVSHPSVRSPLAPGPTLTLSAATQGGQPRLLQPWVPIGESGIRSGDFVSLSVDSGASSGTARRVASVQIQAGPDAGQSFDLPIGSSFIGRERDCAVRLTDPLVSKRHVRVNVADVVEIIDENSANGTMVGGATIVRSVVRNSDVIEIGDTRLVVVLSSTQASGSVDAAGAIEFNRSPRLDPRYAGVELVAPDPPARPQAQRFPFIPLIAPVLMGGLMFAITRSAASILFVALSPLMLIGSFLENRYAGKKAFETATAGFRASLRDLVVQLQYAGDLERTQRRREHPSIDEVYNGVLALNELTWTRQPALHSFLDVRLGLGVRRSRNTVKVNATNNTTPELWNELRQVIGQHEYIDRIPVVASLVECGSLGVAGPPAVAHRLAAATVSQIVGLHSPAEVVIAAVVSTSSAPGWEWLKWLPHSGSDHSPLACEHLASTPATVTALVSALEDLIESREPRGDQDPPVTPAIVVIVEDDGAIDRARLVTIGQTGPRRGVHLVWCAAARERLPAICKVYLEVEPNTGEGRVGFVANGEEARQVELEPLGADHCVALARRLAPVTDSGALLEDQSDLPRSIAFTTLAGAEVAESSDDVIERWKGSNSLPPSPGAHRLKRDNTLKALVGQGAVDRFYLDLRTHGPHALVGGTTGAGKSEFLQSWILGMAVAHSPARVNFLFVDYKGGAAFADCVNLPHCVGLVTDLSPHLVRRALRSLNAELRRREHLLNGKRAKDLLELERRRDPETPPSLVIVVDEFAALVSEVPEFVDGVVNVAQRGRSLGLHLILATQRPAGVIKDNLRANTNLRVALRMADEADSDDVIGTSQAAAFDPALPGRAVAKTGPGRLTVFQSAYVGGHTSRDATPPQIDVNLLPFGVGTEWDVPESVTALFETPSSGPTDIARIVANVKTASRTLALPEARQPWLPDLAPVFKLEELPGPRNDVKMVFGVIDIPDEQAQPTVDFEPDADGNMAVYGTGGSGKSGFLRSLAVAAGFSSARGGPTDVYCIDLGARGLAMLEVLPHVGAVINGDDVERITRLLKHLRSVIDERAERFAAVRAADIVTYRATSGSHDEARILLLVDNFGAFRQQFEIGPDSRLFDLLLGIAADGRSVGVHVVVSADRPAAVPASLGSSVQKRLVLRLANEMDYAMLGAPDDVLTVASPPGRGVLGDAEVQVAIFGGDANTTVQAQELVAFAASMRKAGVRDAMRIGSLSPTVTTNDVPRMVAGEPVLGIWDETLDAIGFSPSSSFLVTGPPHSGRTSTVAWMLTALDRSGARGPRVLFGARRSALTRATEWTSMALDVDSMERLAVELTERLAADDDALSGLVVVIESIADLLSTSADLPLQDLIRATRNNDGFVIAEGETSTVASSWPLLQTVRSSRCGIALQPEQMDGDNLFKTSFPRVKRADFPQGRGLHVRNGRVYRVQVPLL